MITWLIVIIFAYFAFALAFFGDKLVLAGPPKARSYTFYVGALNILAILLIPFFGINIPRPSEFFWIIIEGMVYVAGLYTMFMALEKFDVSRVMTTIGAIQPIFILFITWVFFGFEIMNGQEILAFILLLLGTVLISLERKQVGKSTGSYFKITIISAIFFSLDYVFQKIIYNFSDMTFMHAFIWMRIFSFIFALLFLLSKKSRKEIFGKETVASKKSGVVFVFTQSCGGLANMLQSYAIYLAPAGALAIINSLRGIQYVFLFLITIFFTLFFPKIFEEETSLEIVIQKVVSIILIVIGLSLLVVGT